MIRIEKPDAPLLAELGVDDWPVWEHGIGEFPWHYNETETCFILDGEVTVTPDDGDPVQICKGDLAMFPAGMSCRWNIASPIRKHYRFD